MQRDLGVVHVVVDEPQVGAKSIPAVWETTDPDLELVRLHGRNHETWDIKGAKAASERFDYDYTDEELASLAAPIRRLADHVGQLQVVFNNNAGDQGQRNGRSLMRILGADAVDPSPAG